MFPSSDSVLRLPGPWGVPIEVHRSFGVLAGIFALLAVQSGAIVFVTVQFAMLVAAILLHELGHAWGGHVQGVPVRRVVLHGGGGFCEYAHAGTAHQQELMVAMGPLVNLALWALASLGVWWLQADMIETMQRTGSDTPMVGAGTIQLMIYLSVFAKLNLMLFAFNMIPVQPLDGGRLLHLGLLHMLPDRAALRMTGAVGVVASVLWLPVMIGLYVWMGFILIFIPSLALHLEMYRAGRG